MSIALAVVTAVAGGLSVGSLLAFAVVFVLRRTGNSHAPGLGIEGLPLIATIVGLVLASSVLLLGLRAAMDRFVEPVLCSWSGEEELIYRVRIHSETETPRPYFIGSASGFLSQAPQRRDPFWVWTLPTDATQLETFSGELVPAFIEPGRVTIFSALALDPESPAPACSLTFHGL